MKTSDQEYRRQNIYLICDNYGIHKHPTACASVEYHGCAHLHLASKSASWRNLAECWFGCTPKAIRSGVSPSVAAFEGAVLRYAKIWNENPKPSIWTETASRIRDSTRHAEQSSVTGH